MAETFGWTEQGVIYNYEADRIVFGKYPSGSAGTLASISVYIKERNSATPNIKCAIYDASGNLLANGTTEEKQVELGQDGWMSFNFATPPSVDAATDYCLAFWLNGDYSFYYNITGGQRYIDLETYGSWPDPCSLTYSAVWKISVYATYVEAPPPAVKTLVQAALISIPPLIVLPTLAEILRLTGGC